MPVLLRGFALLAQHGEESVHDVRVPETSLGLLDDGAFGVEGGECRLIRTRGGQRVIDVHDLEHAREQWYLLAGEAVRISGTIPMLVMAANDWQNITHALQRPDDLFPDDRMLMHSGPF